MDIDLIFHQAIEMDTNEQVFKTFNHIKHWAINSRPMLMYTTIGYVYFLIFGNSLTKLQNDASK
jgi:hypothetical protein